MKRKILLIDDKNEFRRLTKLVLSNYYDVDSAESGIQAMAMLQNGYSPDLIVCDLLMPEMDGEEFLRQIRSSGVFKHIPVIVLSSIDKSVSKARLIQTGAQDYITKPYNPEELIARIDNQLRNPVMNVAAGI